MMPSGANHELEIAAATPEDVPLILSLVRELADYEKLGHEAVATEEAMLKGLFGEQAAAAALVAKCGGEAAGFALYFHNFSTFLGRPGLYLEDLFVRPAFRGRSIGKALLRHLARIAMAKNCGRFEWAVLDWNQPAREFYESLGARSNPAWVNYRITGEALEKLAGPEGLLARQQKS